MAQSISKRSIVFEVLLKTDEIEKGVKKANKSLSGFENTIKKVGATLAGAFAVQQLVQFTKELARTSVQMEAFNRRAEVVFGDSIGIVEDFGKKTAKSLGLTQNQFKGAAAAIGDLIVPLGLSRKEAATMSVQLTKLGGALKQFTGDQRSAAEISNIVARALTGEVEGLKTLGVSINQNTKEFKDAVNQKIKDRGVTELQAKALVIYETALARSSDALNSFNTDTDSLTRKTQELAAEFDQIKETLAGALTPVFLEFAQGTNALFTGLNKAFGASEDFSGGLNKQIAALQANKAELNARFRLIQEGNLSENQRKDIIDKLNPLIEDLTGKQLDQNSSLKDFVTASQEANKAIDETIAAKVKQSVAVSQTNKLAALTEQIIADEIELNKQRTIELGNGTKLEKRVAKDLANFQETKIRLAKEEIETIKEQISLAGETVDSLFEQAQAVDDIGNKTEDTTIKVENLDKAEKDLSQQISDLNKLLLEQAIAGDVNNETLERWLMLTEQLENANFRLNDAIAQQQGLTSDATVESKGFIQAESDIEGKIESRTTAGERLIQSIENQAAAEEEAKQIGIDGAFQLAEISKQAIAASFEDERKAALFSVAIDTAVAIAKGIAQFGPPPSPAGIAAIASATAIGALQLALIAAQPKPFAEGVIDLQGGVKGKDSIPSLLMPGESVMTTAETSQHKPLFESIRSGNFEDYISNTYIEPAVMNSISSPSINFTYDDTSLKREVKNSRTVRVSNLSDLDQGVSVRQLLLAQRRRLH